MPLSRSCSNTTPAVLKTIFDLVHTLNKFWGQSSSTNDIMMFMWIWCMK
jgi:hypothetical protein